MATTAMSRPSLEALQHAEHCRHHHTPQGLKAADKVFGSSLNSKGFRVINGAGVIQGDGISVSTLADISRAVLEAGYSPESVAYGMGGGLLQKVGSGPAGCCCCSCGNMCNVASAWVQDSAA